MRMNFQPASCLGYAVTTAAAVLLGSGTALADQLTIKQPGAHPNYKFEAEPHLLLGIVDPPGPGSGSGFGIGFRGTVTVLQNGFINSINNSIGIGFGLDWVHYGGRDYCVRVQPGGCVFQSLSANYFWIPVVMQWNFWLSRNWSVFGEPGFGFRHQSNDLDSSFWFSPFHFYAGGRFHFNDRVTLTMRLGYPTFSIGASFLL